MTMNTLGSGRSFLKALPGISVMSLLVLTVGVVLLHVSKRYPLEACIVAGVLVGCGILIVLYMWELVIIGWVVDFLAGLGMPKLNAGPIPLEYEQVGEMVVVTLRDNIAGVLQCQAVQKQLKHLIDEHHCDFVLDLLSAAKISHSFREVMMNLRKAAQKEAKKLGKPYRPVVPRNGPAFKVFDDRKSAVEEMSRHEGHGWVVLCSVPVGVRAVSGLT